MFTGIVEEIGIVKTVRLGAHSSVLIIQGNAIFTDLKIGDSVAVNGVCLTATALGAHTFTCDVMHETLNRSSLRTAKAGARVNLERAMVANGRFGGHIVSGHIDGLGKISKLERDDNAIWYTIQTDASIMKYIVEKGSIAIDGISLTIAKVWKDSFQVSIIPHTNSITILGEKHVGDMVNLENDVIGKYVERLLSLTASPQPVTGVTVDFLKEHGLFN